MTHDDLTMAVEDAHAVMAAASTGLLEAIRAADAAETWKVDGSSSMAAWVCMRLGVSRGTGSEWVRVARRLAELPAVAAAYADGRLSWDRLCPVTRLANAETDAEWAERAQGWSPFDLQRAVRRRRLDQPEDAGEPVRHYARTKKDLERGVFDLWARLPLDRGTQIDEILDQVASDLRDRAGVELSFDQARAIALVDLVCGERDAPPVGVVVHVDAEAAEVEGGPVVGDGDLLHLVCDAWFETASWRATELVSLSATTDKVPRRLRRQLRRRDWNCRFPGCGRTRFVHAHHLWHWAFGGPTEMWNLVLLCGFHHRLVHKEGFFITGRADDRLTFHRPDGRVVGSRPPPVEAA